MPRYRPPFRQALALRHIASLCTPGNEARLLPPVRELARAAGVSRHTMLAALHRACESRALISHGRRGFMPACAAPPTIEAPAAVRVPARAAPRSRQIAEHLRDSILAGAYPPGALLPPAKMLCARLGAGHAAVRAALDELASHGFAERRGRGWRVFTRSPARRQALLALIGPTRHLTQVVTTTPWSMEFCLALMQECNRLGVTLELFSVDEAAGTGRDRQARIRDVLDLDRRRAPVGYAVYVMSPQPDPHFEGLVRMLQQTGKPAAIFDDFGTLAGALRLAPAGRVRAFTRSSALESGRAMGRYLLSLGHRRIAYIPERSPDVIFDARGEGLRSAFASAGVADGVVALSPGPYAGASGRGRLSPRSTRLLRVMDDLRSDEDAGAAAANLDTLFLRSLDLMARNTLSEMAEMGALAERASPVFGQVIARSDITAWVGGSDRVALLGYALALDRRMRVPAQVSIAGFDDWLPAASSGITSYNFNVAAIARRMVDFVVSPRRGRGQTGAPIVETPGFVVERRSCAAARR